jgi:uncharacterized membrane protein
MLETIGFIVWVLITLCLTAIPFLIGCLVALGGGFGRVEKVVSLVFMCLAAVSWYFISTSLSVSIN